MSPAWRNIQPQLELRPGRGNKASPLQPPLAQCWIQRLSREASCPGTAPVRAEAPALIRNQTTGGKKITEVVCGLGLHHEAGTTELGARGHVETAAGWEEERRRGRHSCPDRRLQSEQNQRSQQVLIHARRTCEVDPEKADGRESGGIPCRSAGRPR